MSQTTLAKGEIEYVNASSGCGFITSEDTVQDVLFLRTEVIGAVPDVGEEVEFEILQTTKDGPRAKAVRRV